MKLTRRNYFMSAGVNGRRNSSRLINTKASGEWYDQDGCSIMRKIQRDSNGRFIEREENKLIDHRESEFRKYFK